MEIESGRRSWRAGGVGGGGGGGGGEEAEGVAEGEEEDEGGGAGQVAAERRGRRCWRRRYWAGFHPLQLVCTEWWWVASRRKTEGRIIWCIAGIHELGVEGRWVRGLPSK